MAVRDYSQDEFEQWRRPVEQGLQEMFPHKRIATGYGMVGGAKGFKLTASQPLTSEEQRAAEALVRSRIPADLAVGWSGETPRTGIRAQSL